MMMKKIFSKKKKNFAQGNLKMVIKKRTIFYDLFENADVL